MSNEESNEAQELDPSLLVQEPEQETPAPGEAQAQEQPDDDIPDKYRGKSAAEIIRMHQDAERLLGKQGNEVGELRKIVDDILVKSAQPSQAPEPELDFFDNPKKAIEASVQAALNSDSRLKTLEQQAAEAEKVKKSAMLKAAHPDYMEVVNSPDFIKWVTKSERRLKRFQESHTNFDTETASELLDDYKELASYRKQGETKTKASSVKAANAASTGSAKASGESRGKPLLSRDALIELKRTNPEKYYANIEQIKQAYLEDRVR